MKMKMETEGIRVACHRGTWYVIDTRKEKNRTLRLLEHEEYGDEAACVIIDDRGFLVMEDVWNGFDDYDEAMEDEEEYDEHEDEDDF